MAELGLGARLSLPDGGWLRYAMLGARRGGTPIVLLRPLGGSMALWGEYADRLAEHLPVVAFDPRGVGESSDLPSGHGTRAMAHDALALLDGLGLPRAHVFGLSLGGMVAQWLAADVPDRLDHLVLASTLPRASAGSPRGVGQGARLARCLIQPGVAAEVCLVRRILSPEFRAREPERVREIERQVRAVPARRSNLLRLVLAASRHDIGQRLSASRVPTLMLFGALDRLTGGRTHDELRHDVPLAALDVVPAAGHDLPLERPGAVAERVLTFLAGHAAILGL